MSRPTLMRSSVDCRGGAAAISRKIFRRRRWTTFAIALSVISMTIELSTHICASSLTDPLPDLSWVLAYAFLTAMLYWNEKIIARCTLQNARVLPQERATILHGAAGTSPSTATMPAVSLPGPRWPLAVSIVGSGAALCIAVVFTILFLPLLPLSIPAILFFGLGLCCWSPLINLVMIIGQWRRVMAAWDARTGAARWKSRTASLLAGIAAITLLVGRPILIGYFVQRALLVKHPNEDTVASLRIIDGTPVLAQLCFERDGSVWVRAGRNLARHRSPTAAFSQAGSIFDSDLDDQLDEDDTTRARKLYYLLTGRPYETIDSSQIRDQRHFWDGWDPVVDQTGGELVGRSVPGLYLERSKIDGAYDPATETYSLNWILRWHNSSNTPAEARMEVLLPEGGVVDHASLWINGVERPAVISGRTLSRTAYESEVVQHRDPLLVTTRTPERVVVQCYPAAPSGDIQIRLGISAPLRWQNQNRPRLLLLLPAIRQANFVLPDDRGTALALSGSCPAVAPVAAQGSISAAGSHTITEVIPLKSMLDPAPIVLLPTRAPRVGDRLGAHMIRAASPFNPIRRPLDVVLAVDTSINLDSALDADWNEIRRAFAALPSGSRVRLMDTRTNRVSRWLAIVPGAGPDPGGLADWRASLRFEGGTEAVPALARAWDDLTKQRRQGVILWLHGATPEDFGDASGLDNRYRHMPDGPVLAGIQILPGPDSLMDHLNRHPHVLSFVSRKGMDTVEVALEEAAATLNPVPSPGLPLGGRIPAVNGVVILPSRAAGPSDCGAVRSLEVDSAALRGWYRATPWTSELRILQRQAMAAKLITPLTGALVLASRKDYANAGINPENGESQPAPSVPEPSTWAMLALAAVGCLTGRLGVRRRSEPGEKVQ